jgi:hypothetical protein
MNAIGLGSKPSRSLSETLRMTIAQKSLKYDTASI